MTRRLRERFELVYLTGWAPSPDQPRPAKRGSATQRVADDVGAQRWSVQNLGRVLVFDTLGVAVVSATQAFGNFVRLPLSALHRPATSAVHRSGRACQSADSSRPMKP